MSRTRRDFLGQSGAALAWAGLAALLGKDSRASGVAPHGMPPQAPRLPHFSPKAKRAIYLFMSGGPSQFETWDYKPRLAGMFGQDLPGSVRGREVAAQALLPIAPSRYAFQQYG